MLPITSSPPRNAAGALPIPDGIKERIGLDRARSAWVVIVEANVFTWPGFDLVPQPNGGFVRGVITRGFFERIRDAMLNIRERSRMVDRDG